MGKTRVRPNSWDSRQLLACMFVKKNMCKTRINMFKNTTTRHCTQLGLSSLDATVLLAPLEHWRLLANIRKKATHKHQEPKKNQISQNKHHHT